MFFQHYSATPFFCSHQMFYEILRIFSPSLILSGFSPWIYSIHGWQIHLQVTWLFTSWALQLPYGGRHAIFCSLFHSGAVTISQRLRPFESCRSNLYFLTVSKLSFLCGDVCHFPFMGTFHIPRHVFLWPFLRLFLSAKVSFHFARAVWLYTESWVPTFFSAS